MLSPGTQETMFGTSAVEKCLPQHCLETSAENRQGLKQFFLLLLFCCDEDFLNHALRYPQIISLLNK